jgi:hypothetical protein
MSGSVSYASSATPWSVFSPSMASFLKRTANASFVPRLLSDRYFYVAICRPNLKSERRIVPVWPDNPCTRNRADTCNVLLSHEPRRKIHVVLRMMYTSLSDLAACCADSWRTEPSPDSLLPEFLATRRNSGLRLIPSRPWKQCVA